MTCHPERSVLERSRKPALSEVEWGPAFRNFTLGIDRIINSSRINLP